MGYFRELKDVFKSSGIRGVKNNMEYELEKTDRELEKRKQIIKILKKEIERLRNTWRGILFLLLWVYIKVDK